MSKHNVKNKVSKASKLKILGALVCMMPTINLLAQDIIVFHNCENLFYPQNDSLHADDDYTINGKKHWTFKKYNAKLNALAKTYISIDAKQMPTLIGLAEVESDTVLRDLTLSTPLRKVNYKFIHYPSKDIRGIDVALLYNPKRFNLINSYPLQPEITKEEDRTRDVLYVKGEMGNMNINIYVIHAPSRRENNIKRVLREKIFAMVRSHIDSISKQGEENFIVMGDMNDDPNDIAVKRGFGLKKNYSADEDFLTDLMQKGNTNIGSYVYSGTNHNFDQFIVSKSIKERIIFEGNFNNTFIYKPDFLITPDAKSAIDIPFSTYKGMIYQGGISDHFPIIMKIK